MNEFIKKLNKYIILIIISALFGMPWFYLKYSIVDSIKTEAAVLLFENIPSIVNYLIKGVIIVLLIIDMKKEKFKGIFLACVAAFLYPLLGVVIYALMLVDKASRAKV